MKRRHFLALSVGSVALSSVVGPAIAASGSPTLVAIVLTDISAAAPIEPLLRCLEAFVSNGISITCGLILPTDLAMEGRFRDIVRRLAALGPSVDFALQLPAFGTQSPYFQARAVFDGQVRLSSLFGGGDPAVSISAILCDPVADGLVEPTGARASGVRNVLVKPALTTQVHSETWPNGVVRFYGGQWVGPDDTFAAPSEARPDENQQLYYLSANSLDTVTDAQVSVWLSEFIASLQRREMSGQAALLAVSDLQLRDDFQLKRLVTIVLVRSQDALQAGALDLQIFQDQLRSFGLPSCIISEGDDFWVQKVEAQPLIPTRTGSKTAPFRVPPMQSIRGGYWLSLKPNGVIGVDGDARLHLPVTRLPQLVSKQNLSKKLSGTDDIVLIIPAAQIAAPSTRINVLTSIQALREDGVTEFSNVFDFVAGLAPQGFIETRHRLTVAARVNAQMDRPKVLDDVARAQLLADARQAWSYFEKHTNAVSGLCPSTIDSRSGGEILEAVTMWDVGSNINALMAAVELGLIDEEQFSKTVKRILPNIRGRKTQGRNLPQGWIRTDRVRWGNRDFDGCDAGRLLAALDSLRRRHGMGKELEAIVAGWDLEQIVINQEINSVVNGKLQSTYVSHCAHYAALAFRRWGVEAASPYEVFTDREPADGEMALLEAAAKIGAFGAEPLLLEAVEMGMSEESAFVADALFSAQVEEFEVSGRLVCVSETPIEKSPWFIYQGLQLGSGLRDWRLNGVEQLAGVTTREDEQNIMAFVTKAAYLWAAYKPGVHADRLLAYARKHSQSELGFASSVNLKSQRATAEYSDINTNAIILQSIAYMLRGGAGSMGGR